MTGKERVYAAIRGERTDRVPVFMWYSAKTLENLGNYLKIPPQDVERALGNDVFSDWLTINKQMSRACAEGERFTDEWGIVWEREGEYNTPIFHPFAELDAAEIAAAPLPKPEDPARYQKIAELIANDGATHFVGADCSGSLFEPAYHLRGMENLLVDLISEAEEADVLLDRLTEFTASIAEHAIDLGVDWIWLGDDFGTQLNMIVSPELWRKYFKPRMKRIIDRLRARRPGVVIAYHSCGSIHPIIGDLVEIGIDVLNPIQESATGMEHALIRREFPNLTMFCGLDTQQYLAHASPDEIFVRTREEIAKLGAGGRYIFGASHTVQSDVPPENILAMLRAVKE